MNSEQVQNYSHDSSVSFEAPTSVLSGRKVLNLLRFSPDPDYIRSIERFLDMPKLPHVPNPYNDIDELSDRFGEDAAIIACYEVDNAIEKVSREENKSVVGLRIADEKDFSNSLSSAWDNQLTEMRESGQFDESEIDKTNEIFHFWYENRDRLSKEGVAKKAKSGLSNIYGSTKLSAALALMRIGSLIKHKVDTTSDVEDLNTNLKRMRSRLNRTALQAADVMMQTPIWSQMEKEVSSTLESVQEHGGNWTEENNLQLVERIGTYYGIAAEENPLLQNPDLIRDLGVSTGANVAAGVLRNIFGYGAYFSLKFEPHVRDLIHTVGEGKSLVFAATLAAGAAVSRYYSDKKALVRDGYSSYFPETAINTKLNAEPDANKENNAKRAALIGTTMNTAWTFTNPRWVGLLAWDPIAYTASTVADQASYMFVNSKALRSQRSMVKVFGSKKNEN